MHLKFLFFICTLNGSIYILYDNANYCVNSMYIRVQSSDAHAQ